MRKIKTIAKRICLGLLTAALVLTTVNLPANVSIVCAAEAGARTYASGNDLFIGGNYIELGLRSTGVFGTTSSAPTSGNVVFHPRRGVSAYSGSIGLRSNGNKVWSEGLATGNDATVDFFLPGTIDEGWIMGWSTTNGQAATYQGRSQAYGGRSDYNLTSVNNIVNESNGDTLKASTRVVVNGSVQMNQVISFGVNDKFFQTSITLTNTSTNTLYDLSYIRAFDPDQKSGLINSATDNYFYKDESGNIWVMAFGNNSLYAGGTATAVDYDTMITNNNNLMTPFIFCAPVPSEGSGYSVQAVNTTVGWSDYNSFYRGNASFQAGDALYGTHYYADKGIGLEFIIPSLAPNASVTFSYISSLDTDVVSAIEGIKGALGISLDKEYGMLSGFEPGKTYTIATDDETWTMPIDEEGNYDIRKDEEVVDSGNIDDGVPILEEWYGKTLTVTVEGSEDESTIDITIDSGNGGTNQRNDAPNDANLPIVTGDAWSIKLSNVKTDQQYIVYKDGQVVKNWFSPENTSDIVLTPMEEGSYVVKTRYAGSNDGDNPVLPSPASDGIDVEVTAPVIKNTIDLADGNVVIYDDGRYTQNGKWYKNTETLTISGGTEAAPVTNTIISQADSAVLQLDNLHMATEGTAILANGNLVLNIVSDSSVAISRSTSNSDPAISVTENLTVGGSKELKVGSTTTPIAIKTSGELKFETATVELVAQYYGINSASVDISGGNTTVQAGYYAIYPTNVKINPSIEDIITITMGSSSSSATSTEYLTQTNIRPTSSYFKAETRKRHTHHWTFTGEDNTISAYCTAEEGQEPCAYDGESHAVILTLEAGNVYYSDEPYESANVSMDEGFPVAVTDSDITYYSIAADGTETLLTEAPENAGNYKAKVTVEEEIAEKSFVISKTNQTDIAVAMSGYNYGGEIDTPSTPALTGDIKETPTITYYYNTTGNTLSGEEWKDIDSMTLEPGTYYIYAVLSETSNYNQYITAATEFVVDRLAVNGIIDGAIYCNNKIITVTGCNIDKVIINEQEVMLTDGQYELVADGSTYEIVVCDTSGNRATATVTLNNGHTWKAPVFIWSDDYNSATAKFVCDIDKTHEQILACTVESELTKEATGTQKGEMTYTATVEFEGNIYKDVKKIETVVVDSVEMGNGTISTQVVIADDVPKTEIKNLTAEVAKTLLTSEEIEAVDNGADVVVYLETTNINSTIESADQELVKAKLDVVVGSLLQELGLTSQKEINTGVSYIDISLYKKVGDLVATKLTGTGSNVITVTVGIPDNMKSTNEERIYYIIRVHDNNGVREVEVIPSVYDKANATLTFTTNKFSTYAIAYAEPNGTVVVTGVSLDKHDATITEKNGAVQLTATVMPNNATNHNVAWKSSDTNVATVDANGKVTAVGNGTCTITVVTEDGGMTDTCMITVKNQNSDKDAPKTGDNNHLGIIFLIMFVCGTSVLYFWNKKKYY